MEKRAFVLLSGGVDSTTCLYKAYSDFQTRVSAVSVFYNQRHKRELEYAKLSCVKLGIDHTVLDVGDLLAGKDILLSGDSVGSMEMVNTSYANITGVSPSYVPFRNGLLLSAITAHAQKYVNAQIDLEVFDMVTNEGYSKESAKIMATGMAKDLVTIYYGAHAEDSANWAYPDCTPEFNGSMANAIYTGSYNTIRLATPLQWLEKSEVIKLGQKHGVHWEDTWSCYDNKEQHCGVCPTCRARREAFLLASVNDPTDYLVSGVIPVQDDDDIPF